MSPQGIDGSVSGILFIYLFIYLFTLGGKGFGEFWYEPSLKYLIPPKATVIFSRTPQMDTIIL